MNFLTKLFRGQKVVYDNENGFLIPDDIEAVNAYNIIATATRCINLMVDYASPIELNVYNKENQTFIRTDKASKVDTLLDFPNKYQSAQDFWSQHYLYLLLYGSAFIVLENDGLYNLLPTQVTVDPDPRKFIKQIRYGFGTSQVIYQPNEVAITRLHSSTSAYLGTGILDKLSSEINLVNSMLAYHKNVLKTGGIHKYALRTDNILGGKLKDRIREEWKKFSAISSKTAGTPPILEGGLHLDRINVTMADLDFNESVERLERSMMLNLGTPPVLLTAEKGPDIDKVLKLYFLSTVLPLINKTTSALTLLVNNNKEWFRLGKTKNIYVRPDLRSVIPLREDTSKLANAVQSLYAVGLITKNEGRITTNYPKDPDPKADEYLEPMNIAGSNVNPSVGGRPSKDDKKEF